MTDRIADASPRLTARAAGVLYLIVAAAGVFSLSVRPAVIVPGDAAATAANLLASEPLYRRGLAADLVATVCYVGVTALLYTLFRPVSRTISFLAAFFGFAGCAIGAAVSLHGLAPLLLLGGASYLTVFRPDQLEALALLFTRLHGQGTNINFVFFGCYCLTLGYLVLRSAFLPRVLSALLAAAGLAWLTDSFAGLLSPPLASALSIYPVAVGGLGEVAFTLWLLVRGVNAQRWREQLAASGSPGVFDR